ncbi:GNAT family N-acetyltransferase [Lysinibacillus mangiferihumi]|uniref:GNAT family N-acetyltransferase n=1 Tax=Lysinibacillus mangiferihumi TaxID=1130819 RepID=A0A4U2YGF6_9BACI|nr:GNAT family N-acetyltransferase [Lysinibacillus mangiferihumi]TKI60058.1 GNAT family N-acetyltransferase [Lysinibacillus mangiferihumi]
MENRKNDELLIKLESFISKKIEINGFIGRSYKRIREISSVDLKKMFPEQFWSSIQWLSYIENTLDTHLLYLVIEDENNNLMGIIPCQIVTDSKGLLFYNLPRSFTKGGNFGNLDFLNLQQLQALKEYQIKLENENLYPSLIAAIPNSYCGILINPDIATNERKSVLKALMYFFNILAEHIDSKIHGLCYIPEHIYGDINEHLPEGYCKLTVGADSVLSIPWLSFDEYLMNFNDKRRNKIRREIKEFKSSGLKVEVLCGAQALSEDLIKLQLSLRSKYGHGGDPEKLSKSFQIMKDYLDDSIVVFNAILKDEIVGFVLFFRQDNKMYAHLSGFDYEKLVNAFCYPNLCFYEPIKYAINEGINQIYYGLSSYEAKVRRGCELVELGAYISFNTKIRNNAILEEISELLSFSEKQQLNHFHEMVSKPKNTKIGRYYL